MAIRRIARLVRRFDLSALDPLHVSSVRKKALLSCHSIAMTAIKQAARKTCDKKELETINEEIK